MRERWIGCVMMLALGACGVCDADDAARTEAGRLCVAFAVAYADGCARCVGPTAWEVCFEAQRGGCAGARTVRDREVLVGVCLPWLASASCDALVTSDAAGWAACARQFGGVP